jgi:RHS repeat-associated protein
LISQTKTDHVQNFTTYYAYDASGSVLAVYDNNGSALQQKEVPVYASGRVGVYYRQSNAYQYELSDHLGNVRAVIGRNKLSDGQAEVLSYSDYYPFGTPLTLQGGTYRHGYQGQYAEKDPETGWDNFELRMYSARIGRWMTIDPYNQYHSPYVGMGNNPVNGVDPDGGKFLDDIYVNSKNNTAVIVPTQDNFDGVFVDHEFIGYTNKGLGRLMYPEALLMMAPLTQQMFLTDDYGKMRGSQPHKGLDIVYAKPGAVNGTEVRAPVSGTIVSLVTVDDGKRTGGVRIRIRDRNGNGHGLYHLIEGSNSHLRLNQAVTVGEIIGKVGNTGVSSGPHLHYELWYKENRSDKRNPGEFNPTVFNLPKRK